MISSIVISSYSSATLPGTNASSGIGGSGKQFRSFFSFPFVPFTSTGAPCSLTGELGVDGATLDGCDDAEGNTSFRKKNVSARTASRFCARAMFSST